MHPILPKSTAALIAALMLAACQPTSPDPGPPAPDPGPPITDPRYLGPPVRIDLSKCGGDGLWDFVGQPLASFPTTGTWGTLRVIRPGMMVTMEYSETRLNVEVDGAGLILALTCG